MTHTLNQSRGYAFENYLVKKFNQDSSSGWTARRLGGSSVGLPDIIATNNTKSILYSIEAKSTTGNNAYVPNEELVRCNDILDMFSIYDRKTVLLAFKFIKTGERKRMVVYLYRVERFGNLPNIKSITCSCGGVLRQNRFDDDVDSFFSYSPLLADNINNA